MHQAKRKGLLYLYIGTGRFIIQLRRMGMRRIIPTHGKSSEKSSEKDQ